MDDVVDRARALASTLAGHARTAAFRDATRAVEADEPARALQQEYAAAIESVRGREASGQPVEPEQKRKLAALGEQIRRSPILQRFLRANLEFQEMMDVVQHTLGGAIDAVLYPEGAEGGDPHAGHSHGPGESCGAPPAEGSGARRAPEDDEPKKGPILWTP